MRSLMYLVAIAGLALPSCSAGSATSDDVESLTTPVPVPSSSATSSSAPPLPQPADPVVSASESELLESIRPGSSGYRTVMAVDEVIGLPAAGSAVALQHSIKIHSCNELALLEVLGRVDDGALFATFDHYPGDVWRNTRSKGPGGTEVLLAGTPDALHTAFVVLAAWLGNCEEHPYSINFTEADEWGVYHEPLRTLSIGDESFMIDYGLSLRDLPYCDHKLIVVRDDDRLVVIDTYGTISVPAMTDRELVAKAEEAIERLHTPTR